MEIKLTEDEIKALFVLLDNTLWVDEQDFGCSIEQARLLTLLFLRIDRQMKEQND